MRSTPPRVAIDVSEDDVRLLLDGLEVLEEWDVRDELEPMRFRLERALVELLRTR